MINSPGFYQILGEPACGKTLLATLLSKDKRVAWVVTAQEHSPGLWETLGYYPTALIMIETVSAAFDAMQQLQVSVDMIVLDSLASLLTRSSIISTDITANFFMPRVPVLVINQIRYPRAPGGYKWHNSVITIRLRLLRRRPALYTRIGLTQYWLIWWPDIGPQIRKLETEDYCWLPRGALTR